MDELSHQERISDIENDGASEPVEGAQLDSFLNDIAEISDDSGWLQSRRQTNEDTRFCIWDGQSDDGRKRQEALARAPFPFEGASDARLRLADMTINKRVAMKVLAAMRATPKAVGMEAGDANFAGKMETLLKWVLRNQLGASYRRVLKRAASYQEGDAPAAAVIGIWWDSAVGLKPRMLRMGEMAPWIMTDPATGEMIGTPDDLMQIEVTFADPAREADAVLLLREAMPNLTPKRAKQIVKELRETGQAEVPEPFQARNAPCLKALRVMVDVFFRLNTIDDIQRAPAVYIREWLTDVEVKERALTQGWSEEFVEKLLGDGEAEGGFDGQSAFTTPVTNTRTRNSTYSMELGRNRDMEGLFEVITAYFRAVNESDIAGVYVLPFSGVMKMAAKDRELLPYAHGQYPFVYFQREIVNSSLVDSRGVAEIAQSDQDALKMYHDLYSDRVQLETVPPLEAPENTPDGSIVIAPLAVNKRRRAGDIGFMQFPARPVSSEVIQREVLRRHREYFALSDEQNDPAETLILQQEMTDDFTDNVKDVLMQVLQLCQQYLTDAQVQRIVGGNGVAIGRSVEDIQGKFDLHLSFDVRDLDPEFLLKKWKLFTELIVPLDTRQSIQRDVAVQYALSSLDPNLADALLLAPEQADMREIDDEDANVAKIMAGVEPPMMERGQNHRLRLQRLEENMRNSPQLQANLAQQPGSMEIMRRRVDHLKFMEQQQQNAVIGRVGAAPALAK